VSQRAPQRRLEQHAHDTDDDESATDREIDRDVLYARGRTKCGQVERRRLIEEVGRAEAVTFVGEAAAAGRQAEQLEDQEGDDHE
jgi:hypothetical protein